MSVLKRLLAACVMLVLLGQGCTKGSSPEARALSQRTTLKVWGVVDDIDAYQGIFNAFRRQRPYVTIEFKRFRLEEYENEMLNALAEDNGPDVFLIHNTWTDKYLPKILPAPKSVKTAVQTVSGGAVGQKATYEVFQTPIVGLRSIQNDFADVVRGDVVRRVDVAPTGSRDPKMEDRIVAVPMSIDTLALYYNKDLLNASGIPTAPANWSEFQAQVQRIVRLGTDDQIIRAGAGIGTGTNVERAADILSLLMMQNQTQMTDDDGDPTFTRATTDLKRGELPPGLRALKFYADFANPTTASYTWNSAQPNSLDAFTQGTSAFFLGYSYHLPSIRARAPKLNLGMTKVPQIEGNPEVNFANYWNWTVSKKTDAPDAAWALVDFMTSAEQVKSYLDAVDRPAARKALLTEQFEDETLGVFASQVLTAKSWYSGKDPMGAEKALVDLLDEASTAKDETIFRNMLRRAEELVQQSRY